MDFIINPFITVLTFLYSLLGNDMVLSIAVFTVLVRLITFPLTIQQQRSTQSMSLLQPELKKLQEKHKNDKEKLAAEQMALYKQYGVNPVGGCLPLVIQFPIFIGLYQAIIHALGATPNQMLDLGGRLLIPGLDQFVPLNNMWLGMNLTQPPNISAGGVQMIVGVILIGGVVLSTYLQFKVTTPKQVPSSDGKPNQGAAMTQSMGTIMPLMYGFFAINFSIGLSIYFIVSNLVGIGQYFLVKRTRPLTPATPTAALAAGGNGVVKIDGRAKPSTLTPTKNNGKNAAPKRVTSGMPTRRPSKAK